MRTGLCMMGHFHLSIPCLTHSNRCTLLRTKQCKIFLLLPPVAYFFPCHFPPCCLFQLTQKLSTLEENVKRLCKETSALINGTVILFNVLHTFCPCMEHNRLWVTVWILQGYSSNPILWHLKDWIFIVAQYFVDQNSSYQMQVVNTLVNTCF